MAQTPEALLRVGSLRSSITQVIFWGWPGLVLYAVIAWSRTAIIIAGLALVAILTATWWSSATDWHSTASLGPALAGWVALPMLMIGVGLVEGVVMWRGTSRADSVSRRSTGSGSCRAALVENVPGTAPPACSVTSAQPQTGTRWGRDGWDRGIVLPAALCSSIEPDRPVEGAVWLDRGEASSSRPG